MPFTIDYHPLKDGRRLAVGSLDDAPALNALSHDIARGMLTALNEWRTDDSVVLILLRGGGERHFCPGGNVLNITRLIHQQNWAVMREFFHDEYHLDAMLYDYPKPVIAWGNGALMGGGMGVFQGCALRLVTADVRMAMPEVHIGLFPDVGAAWFLRRAPAPLGLFLGLTGVTLNVNDVMFARLADAAMPTDGRETFIARLTAADWTQSAADNLSLARSIAGETALTFDAAASPLAQAQAEIAACCAHDNAADIIAALAQTPSAWLQKAAAKTATASPGAVVFWHRHWQALQTAGKDEVFVKSYPDMMAFARNGEFAEGVRALLIDKDKTPRWRHRTFADVPTDWPRVHDDDIAAANALAECLRAATAETQ